MPQICHAHCPGDGTSLIGFSIGAGVVVVAGGMAIGAVIDQLLLTAAVTVVALIVVLSAGLAYFLRRDRGAVSSREAIGAAVAELAAPPRKSLPAARKAITGAFVITDATETREPARIAIKRDGTVTG